MKEFLRSEFFSLSWEASVQHNKIYKAGVSEKKKNELKAKVKNFLESEIIPQYKYCVMIDEDEHINNIQKLKDYVEKNFSDLLQNCSFTFGTAQKLLNLFCKYLWCISEIQRPPHCPIDQTVLQACKIKNVSWTKIDSKEKYCEIIHRIRESIGSISIACWELELWNKSKKIVLG